MSVLGLILQTVRRIRTLGVNLVLALFRYIRYIVEVFVFRYTEEVRAKLCYVASHVI